ncbi:hypothetical protein IQ235_06170 [Oscillatoriales cyanobacterium LEGE 11467]|uniref:Uncharacterized protein n=1 Tax=Zarconia navalis LEGE 11467 TaxID=1828826 RepID=A0A928VUA8_9CYAN|nr:hypothetical protein [Zarconia navalis]MBE9040377.1 hypothetical protein [Zarconia navalis LEGE 11467]
MGWVWRRISQPLDRSISNRFLALFWISPALRSTLGQPTQTGVEIASNPISWSLYLTPGNINYDLSLSVL